MVPRRGPESFRLRCSAPMPQRTATRPPLKPLKPKHHMRINGSTPPLTSCSLLLVALLHHSLHLLELRVDRAGQRLLHRGQLVVDSAAALERLELRLWCGLG